ncbi:DUF6069 family protein [Rhodococcoides yunnanense]|uniref:DUF6069 family protein n=1 Tax=Rhodococcoides yunnanense TaxID=278209 RepID=UPI000934A252|nr:DUF6069 family protein [Rhodococcus yunnanensis]
MTVSPESRSFTSLAVPALARPQAIIVTTVAALVGNLVLWLIGLVADASFELTDGDTTMAVAPGGVVTLTVIPVLLGTAIAAVVSRWWLPVIRIAQVVGILAPLGTIALTLAADFDTPSTVTLSLMHVVIAVVVPLGLESMRRGASIKSSTKG